MERVRLRVLGVLLMALPLFMASCGGGAGRNCLVIPAQVDLLMERRTASLRDLENKAKQVDRMRASLERSIKNYEEKLTEKALFDSLAAEN